MTKEEIKLFTDNHYELTIGQRIRLTQKDGSQLLGFFKRLPESEAGHSNKLREKNQWEFFIIPSDDFLPQDATLIDGEEIIRLELMKI